MNKFLNFIDNSALFKERKTKTFEIRTVIDNSILGNIMWYSPWRKYCFYPLAATVFDFNCLTEINNKLDELMKERK